ncbi:MAG: UDP-N-acetylglucosamine 2-epimerase (non-hydrolyzing) [Flavobacteriales bacterium]|nr:UDP-N-acetylglucosamine 2-epimerase (non-hydrolyzing) [Flavobacteriales bacterium]
MPAPLRILTIVGARPQFIKAAALDRAIRGPFKGRIEGTIVHTGQHYDAEMSDVFFSELGLPTPDVNLHAAGDRPGTVIARMMEGLERVILELKPDVALVYGDTNSTLAGALAAMRSKVRVAHVEAGLRSFNKRMPEEINRIMADQCSTWLFCPTSTAVRNLEREGYPLHNTGQASLDAPQVLNCGDVMYDNTLHFASVAKERSSVLRDHGLEPAAFILATVHREHNTDDAVRLTSIVRSLIELHARTATPVVLPLHPRTRKRMSELLDPSLHAALSAARGIRLLPPVGYLDMLALETNARLVITDSGGVQKEAYFLARPTLILRAETEWTELVEHGHSVLVDVDQGRILNEAERSLNASPTVYPALFGDGRAAAHICEQILRTA